mmetsp:Transcript_10781/g.25873  ORF Transcript_10781/g.25873 Transcript_10781/m.25873 type:complete len:303 (+) Transcript_10781:65-973(+)
MLKEIRNGVEQVRDGRPLFVRELIVCQSSRDSNSLCDEVQVVYVHGSCASQEQFQLLLEALSNLCDDASSKPKRIRCVLYDMLGCGQSEVIREWGAYSKTEFEADLGAIVEKYTESKLPLYFCSHSYGPNILLSWMNDNSGFVQERNIQGFIFMGTTIRIDRVKPFPDGGHPIFRLPLLLLECLQPMLTKDFAERAVDPAHTDLKQQITSASDANDMFMVQAFYRQTRWITSSEYREAIGTRRVLTIHGVSDKILPIEYGQRTSNQYDGDAKFVSIERAGHLVMIEQPDEVAKLVLAYLNES